MRIWFLARPDGFSLALTEHDTPIDFDGVTYEVSGSGRASAIERESGLQEANRTFEGVLESSKITDTDLALGKWTETQVTERKVDWRFPWAGEITRNVFWITKPTYTREGWTAEMSGIAHWLRYDTGDVATRECPFTVGDGRCGADIGSPSFNDTVGAVIGGAEFGVNNGANFSVGDDPSIFRNSTISWTSGANAGLESEVARYAPGVSPTLLLYQETSYPMSPGDAFALVPGCDQTYEFCERVYSNGANFGGHRFLPGTNKMIQNPSRAT